MFHRLKHWLPTNFNQWAAPSPPACILFDEAVNLKEQKLTIALTLVGSMLGAILVQHLQADILRQILPILVIGIGVYFLLTPKLGERDQQRRLSALPFALIAGGGIGFYDGFTQEPVRSMRWRLLPCAALIWQNPPRMPRY